MNPQVNAIMPPKGSSGGVAETEVPILQQIANLLAGSASGGTWGFIVVNGVAVSYDYLEFTYYDAGFTNIQTIKYHSGGAAGTVVATQTFAYAGNPASTANLSVTAISVT